MSTMINIFNKNEEQVFTNEEIIDNDFIFLAYGDTQNNLQQDFIGTTKNKKKLKILKYSKSEQKLKKIIYNHDKEIVHIIPCNFTNSDRLSYIIVCLEPNEDLYDVACITVDEKYEQSTTHDLGKCDRMPFLFSHNDWYNTLILQNGTNTCICYFESDKVVHKPFNIPRLAKGHTSAFIDVDGDLKPELVLVCEEEDEKVINIYNSNDNYQDLKQKIKIPKSAGPLMFGDFNATGCTDIAYITEEDDTCYINILYNLRNSFISKENKGKEYLRYDNHQKNESYAYSINNSDYHYRMSLDEFKGLKPHFYSDLLHKDLPCGIFVTDINLNTYPDIILLMKDHKNNTHVKILENKHKENDSHRFVCLNKSINELNDIISFSTADYCNRGKEVIIINKVHNGEFTLFSLDNTLGQDHFKISALTISPTSGKKAYSSYVPGISYKYYIEEENVVRIGHQLPQSSFLHLHHPSVFFGLGSINFLVDKLFVGGPNSKTYNQIYSVKTKILPNSDLVLKPYSDGIRVELYLNFAKYVKNIIIVFVIVIITNIFVVIYTYRKQKKKEKKIKEAERFLFNFAAL
ncbi:hypothetical protein BDAP_001065 [Binucleata daphniae]